MWAVEIVVGSPCRNRWPGMAQGKEQVFIEAFPHIQPLKYFTKPNCIGLPGAMQGQPAWRSSCHFNITFEASYLPLSETVMHR